MKMPFISLFCFQKKNDRISAHIKNKYGAPEFADLQLLCNFMSNCIDKKPLCKMHAF